MSNNRMRNLHKYILECELAMLVERRKCKKVIAWNEDFGIDQYVLWNLSNEEHNLDTIWKNLKSSASPNLMKLRPCLTYSSDQSIITWMSDKSMTDWDVSVV